MRPFWHGDFDDSQPGDPRASLLLTIEKAVFCNKHKLIQLLFKDAYQSLQHIIELSRAFHIYHQCLQCHFQKKGHGKVFEKQGLERLAQSSKNGKTS